MPQTQEQVHVEAEESGEIIPSSVTGLLQEGNQEVYKFLQQLYGDIATKSDITKNDRALLLRLSEIIALKQSLKLDVTLEKGVFDAYLALSISLDRKSRKEAVDILRGTTAPARKAHWWSRGKD